MKKSSGAVVINGGVLRGMPLPRPSEDDDKEARGRVLVVGGSAEMPGALVLAATAALRAGAGKLRIATAGSVAPHVACAVPESRVYALPSTRAGVIAASSSARLAELAEKVDAVCCGPGMGDPSATKRLLKNFLPRIARPALVLDADALLCLADDRGLLHDLTRGAAVTPNADEMTEVFGETAGRGDDASRARRTAEELGAVVVLKGRETFIAAPDGRVFVNHAGNVGLATSGSGDVLAGLIAGLAARGASTLDAAVWGVHLHALAGDRVAARAGPLGYLARELSAEVPRLMAELDDN